MITSLDLKAKLRPRKYKKARYYIGHVSMKDLSKIIREFEKFSYKSYEMRRPKHDSTDSYFYLLRQIMECMIRADALHLENYPVRTEMTGNKHILISHVCSTDYSKSKEFLVKKKLSQVCSTDKDESKSIIIDESSTE